MTCTEPDGGTCRKLIGCAIGAWLLLASGFATAGAWVATTASGQRFAIAAEGSGAQMRLSVERRLADGKPDPSFGIAGRVALPMLRHDDPPSGLAVDANGRVLVFGASAPPNVAAQPYVIRLQSSGAPDAGWGDGGRSSDAPAPGGARALDALTLADGRVLVAGTVDVDGDERAAVWHLRADGRLDTAATPASRFVLQSKDASRVVSLTALDGGRLMLGVRVLTDTDMLLEGHAFDAGQTNATPRLQSRQPWPPAWSDAPVWRTEAGASRWFDPAQPGPAVAAVGVTAGAPASTWRPLAPGVGEVETVATGAEAGSAGFNPLAGPRAAPAPAAEVEGSSTWALIGIGIAALALAVVFVLALRVRARARREGGAARD